MDPQAETSPIDRLMAQMAVHINQLADTATQLDVEISADPQQILTRDIALQPASEISPGGSCHLLAASGGWIAVNLAREEDRIAVPAWLERDVDGNDWPAIAAAVKGMPTRHLLERGTMLGLPLSILGEAPARLPKFRHAREGRKTNNFEQLNVLDMSSLWAGPLCGAFFAAAGARVTKLESIDRPDRTGTLAPLHAQQLNGQKEIVREKFSLERIADMVADADILITSARPLALARLGLEPVKIFSQLAGLLWISITAHGWDEAGEMRVGFGDDCAAAGGLVNWVDDRPNFIGDALADPLTGLLAAQHAFGALADGRAGLLDCSMAHSAAYFAQQMRNHLPKEE